MYPGSGTSLVACELDPSPSLQFPWIIPLVSFHMGSRGSDGFPPFPANAYLAATICGFVGQDIVFNLCSGWLPGDECTLPGDFAGCQVGRRIQDCKAEKMLKCSYLFLVWFQTWYACSPGCFPADSSSGLDGTIKGAIIIWSYSHLHKQDSWHPPIQLFMLRLLNPSTTVSLNLQPSWIFSCPNVLLVMILPSSSQPLPYQAF